MNKVKLLSKLQDFFDSDEAKKIKNVNEIKGVLEKLKVKQQKIKKMLLKCKNEEFKKVLNLEVEVIEAQIEKGHKYLKQVTQVSK